MAWWVGCYRFEFYVWHASSRRWSTHGCLQYLAFWVGIEQCCSLVSRRCWGGVRAILSHWTRWYIQECGVWSRDCFARCKQWEWQPGTVWHDSAALRATEARCSELHDDASTPKYEAAKDEASNGKVLLAFRCRNPLSSYCAGSTAFERINETTLIDDPGQNSKCITPLI